MRKELLLSAALVSALALGACGSTKSDRILSGAGLGAAAGAVTGAVTGGDAGTGAVIGGVAGGVIGGVTDRDDVDLGDPIWNDDDDDD
jgi:hypothetical protein